MAYKKNEAVTGLTFALINSTDGSPVTSGTTTGYVILDGGTQGTVIDSPAHEGQGQWSVDLTAAEMNGDQVGLLFTNASAINVNYSISTYEQFDANVVQLAGDTTSSDNIKNQYDGTTGLSGGTFPSNQDQLSNLSSGTGGFNTRLDGFVLTTGSVVSGDYEDTYTVDGVYHQIEDTAGTLDIEYTADVGGNGTATAIQVTGRINGSNDDLDGVYAWNWVGAAWERIGDFEGKAGSTDDVLDYDLDILHTGTGADNGKVKIRFLGTALTSADLYLDKISIGYGVVVQASGLLHAGQAQGGGTNTITLDAGASAIDDFYQHAKVITTYGTGVEQENIITSYNGTNKIAIVKNSWDITPDSTTGFDVISGQVHAATTAGGYDNGQVYVNGIDGVAGTQLGVNGTISNPSDNLPDARVIADAQKIKTFNFGGGALFTLDQDYQNFIFEMIQAQFLDMGGFDLSGAVFRRTGITGTMTATTRTVFERSGLVQTSLGICNLLECGIGGTTVLSDSVYYLLDNCFEFSDTGAPILDINGDNSVPTIVTIANYNGRLTIKNTTSVDVIFLSGNAHVEFDSTCNGGTVYRSGDIKTTDNSTLSPTFTGGVINETNDNTVTIESKIDTINAITSALPSASEIDTELTSSHGSGSWQTASTSSNVNIVSVNGTPTTSIDDFKADTSGLSTFNPAVDAVANVTLVDTTTANTDMRGTDNALLTSGYTAPDNATIAAIDGKVDAIGIVTTNTNAKVTAIDISDLPTNAEFEARTLLSSQYSQFDSSSNEVTINAASVNAIFAGGSIDGYSLEESQRLILAANVGELSGAATSSIVIDAANNSKTRISATVDIDGNRVSVTKDAT